MPVDEKHQPLLPEIGLIGLVPDTWQSQWQPRHQVLVRLAKYFHVIWVSPAPFWRDSISARIAEKKIKFDYDLPPGFILNKQKLFLPRFHKPLWLAEKTAQLRLQHARQQLIQRHCKSILLYLWRPEYHQALQQVPYDHAFYHIDDEYSFSTEEAPLSPEETKVITQSDAVIIHSPALLEKKGHINPATYFVPNGVDFALYSQPISEPRDIAAISHPRIGYTGNVKKQLDWDLISALIERHPEWSFVFVGQVMNHVGLQEIVDRLSARRNVHFLGAKSVTELAAYPQHFDVCIMPYCNDNYTKFIYPLKLHEYLGGGQPVVGTKIRSLEDFQNSVTLATNFEEWSTGIAAALLPQANSPQMRKARQAVARQHDWDLLVLKIARTMVEHLDSIPPAQKNEYLVKLQEAAANFETNNMMEKR